MMMSCSTRTSENKPNGTSEQIDGWMDWGGRDTGLNKRPPRKKKLRSSNPGPFTISTPARGHEYGRPPRWSTEYKVQPHAEPTGARTHTLTHTISRPAGVRPTCNQRTAPVQRHTRPLTALLLDRLSLQDPRQQTTVGRAEIFCLGRLHLHRARPRRPLSLNLTTHGLLLLLPLPLLLLLSVSQSPASQSICRSGSRSTCPSVLSAPVRSVPSTYTAKSSVPPL